MHSLHPYAHSAQIISSVSGIQTSAVPTGQVSTHYLVLSISFSPSLHSVQMSISSASQVKQFSLHISHVSSCLIGSAIVEGTYVATDVSSGHMSRHLKVLISKNYSSLQLVQL